ncbi:hypothetical protein [Streptomyces sp. NPDC001068]|uniref:hypothetical protein n=1 Tax=Streptomyces sp. NPDC001068 TaxID=3364544 RepID=UPI0036B511EF
MSVVPALVRPMLTPEAVFVPLRPPLTRALVLTGAVRPWPPAAVAVLQASAPAGS